MYYQRNLPHIMPPEATLLITFKLAGPLPLEAGQQPRAKDAAPEGERENIEQSYARQRANSQPFFWVLQPPKARTARRSNELLGRVGETFWQPESYDHDARDAAELTHAVAYMLNNPGKAGLVDD